MKLENREVLITKVDSRKNPKGENYIAIEFLDLTSGDNFSISSKEIEYMKLKTMTKYNLDLILTSSRYGLKLSIDRINKALGEI